jgi:hypothetical protein
MHHQPVPKQPGGIVRTDPFYIPTLTAAFCHDCDIDQHGIFVTPPPLAASQLGNPGATPSHPIRGGI